MVLKLFSQSYFVKYNRLLFIGINPESSWSNIKKKNNALSPRVRAYFMEKKDFIISLPKI